MNHQEAEENFDEVKVFLGENSGLMKSAFDQ
jgi:hypothetical protein